MSASDGQDGPVARWYTDGSGAYYKAYPKLLFELRLERVCPSRKTIQALLASSQMPLSGENAARLALEFAMAALPELLHLVQHAEQVIADDRSAADIAKDLLPLVHMAAGQKAARGPAPSPRSAGQARAALDAFLTCGMADARGMAKGVVARKLLDALVASGKLAAHDKKPIYYLRNDVRTGDRRASS